MKCGNNRSELEKTVHVKAYLRRDRLRKSPNEVIRIRALACDCPRISGVTRGGFTLEKFAAISPEQLAFPKPEAA